MTQKTRFRSLRLVLQEVTFEKIGEIVERHPTSSVWWSGDMKKISPDAAVIDFP